MKGTGTFTLAYGALPVLAAAAILVIITPSVQTWLVVLGISVVAGLCSGWSGHERHRLLVSVRLRIDDGVQTAITALAETTAARTETDKLLVDSFERCFAEYGRRNEQSRSNALTEMTKEVTALLGEYGELQEREAKSRAVAIDEELAKVRETFAVAGKTIENAIGDWRKMTLEVERISKRVAAGLQEHVTSALNALQDAWVHGGELRANEMLAEVKRTRAEFEQFFRAAAETLRGHAAAITEQQQHLDGLRAAEAESRSAVLADWARVAEESSNSIRDLASDIGSRLEKLHVAEKNRQEEHTRAERGHFETMLEDQRRAYEDAAERSGQLWGHLLDQLNK